MSRQISVIVVDDSLVMRKSIQTMLESDPQIRVVATARDGREAIEKVREHTPDIITMDIEMPGMDGLSALKVLMKENPLPVIMCSSLTKEGAQATIDAFNLGAVDFIPKDFTAVAREAIRDELVSKVKQIALHGSARFRARFRKSTPAASRPPSSSAPAPRRIDLPASVRGNFRAVVVGISTGGPFALLQTIPKIPADFPLGIVVVQHMPARFTRSMADRLDSLSQVSVKEAEDGDKVEPGRVLIAPGGLHLTFTRNGVGTRVKISDEPRTTLYRPSADIMMTSAAEVFGGPLVGLIMTGMGKDGLEGLKLIKKKGGIVIAQNEESCVVYGMPKAAVDEGIADAVLPLEGFPDVLAQVSRGKV